MFTRLTRRIMEALVGRSKSRKGKTKQQENQEAKSARTTGGKSKKTKGTKPKEEPKKEEPKKKEELPVFERDAGSKEELRISPYAWSKLVRLRDLGDTEIGGFCISRLNDLLYVEDVRLIQQDASTITFEFDDEKLNEYLYDMVKEGYQPVECMRIWVHTHPAGASPSGTDHETFDKVTGEADWGIMFILGKDNATSARLRITGVGRKYDVPLKVRIDWSGEFRGVTEEDAKAWDEEYKRCVKEERYTYTAVGSPTSTSKDREQYYRDAYYNDGDEYYGYGCGSYYEGDMRERWNSQAWKDDGDKDMPRIREDHRKMTMGSQMTPKPEPKPDPGKVKKGKPQMVHIVDMDVEEGVKTVWTDNYWFEYDINESLLIEPGDEIETFREMSLNEPVGWGQVLWSEDDAGNPTYERMSIYDEAENNGSGGFCYLETAADRKAAIDVRTTGLSAADDAPAQDAPKKEKEDAVVGKPSSGP